MQCRKCGSENQESNQFCGKCGARLEAMPAPIPVPGEAGAFYCARHKKVSTRVRCARCGAPICPRCMVPGAVGNLCHACAHQRVPFRWRGFLHATGKGISDNAPAAGRAVWYLVLWSFVMSIIRGMFGGRDT